jgi:hypothetical protein
MWTNVSPHPLHIHTHFASDSGLRLTHHCALIQSCSPHYSGTKLSQRKTLWVKTLFSLEFQPHITVTVSHNYHLTINTYSFFTPWFSFLLPSSPAMKTFLLLTLSPCSCPVPQPEIIPTSWETEPRTTTKEISELLDTDRPGARGLCPWQNDDDILALWHSCNTPLLNTVVHPYSLIQYPRFTAARKIIGKLNK